MEKLLKKRKGRAADYRKKNNIPGTLVAPVGDSAEKNEDDFYNKVGVLIDKLERKVISFMAPC